MSVLRLGLTGSKSGFVGNGCVVRCVGSGRNDGVDGKAKDG